PTTPATGSAPRGPRSLASSPTTSSGSRRRWCWRSSPACIGPAGAASASRTSSSLAPAATSSSPTSSTDSRRRMTTISSVRATPISIPLEAPYHWSCGFVAGFSRTIVEVETSDGALGLGESPSPADAALVNEVLGPLLLGADPHDHADCERRCVPSLRELRTIPDASALHAYTG